MLHSGMSDAQRLDMWERVRSGRRASSSGLRPRSSRPSPTSAWWSSTRSTSPATSRRACRATTPATWRWCGRRRRARCACTAARQPAGELAQRGPGPLPPLPPARAGAGRPLPKVEVAWTCVGAAASAAAPGSSPVASSSSSARPSPAASRRSSSSTGAASPRSCGVSSAVRPCTASSATWPCGTSASSAWLCHSCCDEITIPKVCPSCTAPALAVVGAGSQRRRGDPVRRRAPGEGGPDGLGHDDAPGRTTRALPAFGRGSSTSLWAPR